MVGITAPMVLVPPALSARASGSGANSSLAKTRSTSSRVAGETDGEPFRTRDAVATETPASRATSRRVIRREGCLLRIGRCSGISASGASFAAGAIRPAGSGALPRAARPDLRPARRRLLQSCRLEWPQAPRSRAYLQRIPLIPESCRSTIIRSRGISRIRAFCNRLQVLCSARVTGFRMSYLLHIGCTNQWGPSAYAPERDHERLARCRHGCASEQLRTRCRDLNSPTPYRKECST